MPKFDLSGFSSAQLLKELQHRVKCAEREQKSRIVLIGPPGAGKGTQSPMIKYDYCACHLATGDMLRAAVKNKTPVGLKAKEKMDAGALVDDDIVIGIVKENIKSAKCRNGFILDGFPRNLNQAKALDNLLESENMSLTDVVNMQISDDILIPRLTGRRIHKPSGRSYHMIFNPPKVIKDGVPLDDMTGEPLIQRRDDNEETGRKRLGTFHGQTQDAIDYYSAKGLVRTIDANQKINNVYSDIKAALGPTA